MTTYRTSLLDLMPCQGFEGSLELGPYTLIVTLEVKQAGWAVKWSMCSLARTHLLCGRRVFAWHNEAVLTTAEWLGVEI